jgi:AcrR family transcriptional regulator
MAVASDLFYRQGYRATGINQVIAASGVAKASFYDHFPSKADLLYAYAQEMARREFAELQEAVMALPSARERFFGSFLVLTPWFTASNYRGCPFQNVVAEAPAEDPRVREVAQEHRESLRGFFRARAQDLVNERPQLAGMDLDALTDTYLLLFEGAIATSVAYRSAWPVAAAVRALEGILELQ